MTTLPYVNSVPHIGHSFEFILADAIQKWFKIGNPNVHFNVGLDGNKKYNDINVLLKRDKKEILFNKL